jgi:hypothetical protein
MAIDGSNYSQSQFRLAIAEESTFGTAITTQSSFQEIYLRDPTQIDRSDIVRDEVKHLDGQRVWAHTDIYVNEAGGTRMIPFNAVATDITLDYMLYLVMQDLASEGASTPYLKTFEWDSNTTQPDFTSNNGEFVTANLYNPATSESVALKSCIVNQLTLNWDGTNAGGRLMMQGSLWSGFRDTVGATVTPGDWTAHGTDVYANALNTKTLDGNDIVLDNFSITLNNNAVRDGFDTNGDAELYSLGTDGDLFSVTGSIQVKYDANSKDLIDYWTTSPHGGSAEFPLVFQWGDGSSDGTLKISINAIFNGDPQRVYGTPMGTRLNLPIKGVADGTNEAVEILIANATDRSW